MANIHVKSLTNLKRLIQFRFNMFWLKYLSSTFSQFSNKPILSEGISGVFLHFNQDAVQSAMLKDNPDALALGYTKTMMGFLFFQPHPQRIAMIGLGGGSLAKYCLKYLPEAHFTAIEINPKVISLRDKFSIPADSKNFQVICANGADYVQDHHQKVDVLLIDGFKSHGQPESLSNHEFYKNCYAKLSDNGIMVVNLVEDREYQYIYTARIRKCFNDRVLLINAESRGNKIAFAFKSENFPPTIDALQEIINPLNAQHNLPLQSILNKLLISIETTRYPLIQNNSAP